MSAATQPSDPCIRVAQPDDIPAIVGMANEIWPLAYGPILAPGQIAYMLGWMYAPEQIASEMLREGIRYWIATWEGFAVGFASLGPTSDPAVAKLHKLYVLPRAQGMGWGRRLMRVCVEESRGMNATRLRLAVNKNNARAIAVYRALGFTIIQGVTVDIGQGFVMDDYLMELCLVGSGGLGDGVAREIMG